MHVLPAIDVRGGEVVRGGGGDRASYPVLESELCPTGEPLPFVFALRERFRCSSIYVADLDALTGQPIQSELLAGLTEMGFTSWVDAGIRNSADAIRLRSYGCSVVVASETIGGPAEWEATLRAVDGRRLAFSLDLRDGLAVAPQWGESDPVRLMAEVMRISREVTADSPARLFVIDLGRVGAGRGVGTEAILSHLARTYPEIAVFAGGGIRGPADIERLDRIGVAGVLVSTALHEGLVQPTAQ